MAPPRDDESLHSGGGPSRSTGPNSVRSRHEPASANTSSTNISLRRCQQTPAQLSDQSSRRIRCGAQDQSPGPNSIKGQANEILEGALRTAREAHEAEQPSQNVNTTGGGTTKSRARKIVEESRGGMKSSPKTPAVAHGFSRDDIDASISGSMGAKAHKDKMAELQQETFDLKLRIFHLREKSDETEEQLKHAEVDREDALNERDQALEDRDEAFRERDEANAFADKLFRENETKLEAIMQAAVRITELEAELEAAHKELEAAYKDSESTIMPRGQHLDVLKSPHVPDNSSIRAIKSSPPVKSRPARTEGNDSSNPVQQPFQNTPTPQPAGDGGMVRQPSMPNFLVNPDSETATLRSMFMPMSSHQSVNSLAMASEHGSGYNQFGERTLNSPHMSIISEGSLPSVYPKKKRHGQDEEYGSEYDEDTSVVGIKRQLTKPNIKKWAGDLGEAESVEDIGSVERKQAARQESRIEARNQAAVEKSYVSISDVVEAAPLSTDELQRRIINKNLGIKGTKGIVQQRRQRFSESRTSDSSPAFQAQVRNLQKKNDKRDAESFGGGRILPPTPDTFSTNTLQGQANASNDTLNSTLGGRLNSTTYQVDRRTPNRLHKVPSFEDNMDKRRSRGGDTLFDSSLDHNGNRLHRRRSIAETTTSRREGHGLDTATQSEAVTETNSDMSSEATSKDPYANLRPNPHAAAFNPPSLFNMSSPQAQGYRPAGYLAGKQAWDITPDLKTPGKARIYTAMGHRHRESDTTPTKGPYRERSYSAYSIETRRQSAGPEMGNSFQTPIKAPDRRSSLAGTPISNEKRMRRLRETQEAASINSSSPLRQKGPSPAKAKQPSITITTEPLLDTSQLSSAAPTSLQQAPEQKKGLFQRVNFGNFRNITNPQFLRGQKENKALEEERATPPPIMRSGKKERTVRARREAAQRHLHQQWSSPNPAVRPSTADGGIESGRESRRAVTFGGEENRDNRMNQPSQQGSREHQDELEEMDEQKKLDAESKAGKKWGFSLGNMGNRTLRRK